MADSSQPQRFCRQCGGQVRSGTNFCVFCGAPLSAPQVSGDQGEESSSGPRGSWTQWASFGAIAGLLTGLRGLVSKKVIVMIMGVAGATATAIGAMSDVSSLGVNIINPGAKDVEIVDIGFGGALDLKLENAGDDPVFFKRADLQVEKIWTLVPPYYYNRDLEDCHKSEAVFMAPSFDYEVSIPTQGAPYTATTALSQSIKPNETDRFTITPIPDSGETDMEADYIYLMSLSLVYGSDDSVLSSQDLLVAEGLTDDSRSYQPGDCWLAENNAAQLEADNKQALSEIKNVQAKEDPYLEHLYQQIQ